MSDVVLFISEQDIKDTSFIDENVDAQLIRDVIELAQDKYIVYLTGSTLFAELKTVIDAGTLSGVNATLVNTYISKALKWWTLYEGLDILTYKFTNKSIVKKNSENSQSASVDDLNRLMDSFKNNAEMYSQRVTQYLKENITSFTSYSNPGSGVDVIQPKYNSYTTSIYLGC